MQRRDFIKIGTLGGVGLFVSTNFGFVRRVFAQITGGSLAAGDVDKFVLDLVKPPAMPPHLSNKNKDFYKIAVRQFEQRILSPPHPVTPVWSYGSVGHAGSFHYPAFTIEASWNKTVQVQWRNELVDDAGNFLPHLLPVDPTLHWANPPLSNYPDPFNPATTLRFELPEAGDVSLEVYDVAGRRVATLVRGSMGAGLQQVPFDASGLPSGLYFSRLEAAGQTVSHKMLLVK